MGFSKAGADLILVGRRLSALERVAEEINGLGRKAFPIVADIGNYKDIQGIIGSSLKVFPRINILVNNAGISPVVKKAEETTLEEGEEIVRVMKRKRSNKYEKILIAAEDLICKKGYKAASLQEIANQVGIRKTSLFHYVENKEDLLRRILKSSLAEVGWNLEKIVNNDKLSPEEKLREAIKNHIRLPLDKVTIANQIVFSNEFYGLSKKTQKMFLEQRRKYERDFKKIVIELKRYNYLNGLDTTVVTLGLFGMLNWVPKWYRSDGPLGIEEICNIFCKMILGKVKARKPRASP